MSHEIIKDSRTYYPLTTSQKDIIQGEECGKQYSNICILFTFDTKIDADVMEKAANVALERMPTARLRKHNFKDKKNPNQKVILQYFSDEPIEKVQRMSFKSEEKMRKYLAKISKKPFPNGVQDVTLYQLILIDLPDGKNSMYCKMNHFINDAYGIMVLAKDVIGIYDAMCKGTELPKAPTPVLPAFEEQWNNEGSSIEAKAQAYWDKFWTTHELPQWTTLNNAEDDILRIPGEKYGNQFNIFHLKAEHVEFPFKKELVDKVNKYAVENGVSSQAMFLLAYRTYLSRAGGNVENLVLQTMNANRSKRHSQNTGGTLVTGYMFYFDVKNSETFADACKYTSKMQLEYYKHCKIHCNKAEVKLDANIPPEQKFVKGFIRDWTTNMFTYQPYRVDVNTDIKFRMERFTAGITAMQVYLTVMYMDNYSGDLMGCYDYSTYTLNEEKIKKFHDFMCDFLDKGTSNPQKTLTELMQI